MTMLRIQRSITYMTGDQEGQILMGKTLAMLSRHVALDLVRFDLGLANRIATGDRVTLEAAEHLRTTRVGLKAPTITQRAVDPEPRFRSPNITIRRGIGGVAIVREANLIPGVLAPNRHVAGPIVVIRKATEGIYEGMEWQTEDGGRVYRQEFMSRERMEAVARFAVEYALENDLVLWSATKHTISRIFEGTFQRILDAEAAAAVAGRGLRYQSWLIDAVYQALMRPPPRLAIVCDSFNGDCLGDLVPAMYGSVAGCGSILVGDDGARLFDPPHGTAPSLQGLDRANPLATLIAVAGAIAHASRLGGHEEGVRFAARVKDAAFSAIADGVATFDLAGEERGVPTSVYLAEVSRRL
jgi:isocitrate dehydrogenase (NAD+)